MGGLDEEARFWFSEITARLKDKRLYIKLNEEEGLTLELFLQLTDCDFGYFFGRRNRVARAMTEFFNGNESEILGWEMKEEDLSDRTAFPVELGLRVLMDMETCRVWKLIRKQVEEE